MRRRQHSSSISFIDLLFNIILGIFLMFMYASLMINIKDEKPGLESKAEYIITAEWPVDHDADVDLWVEDPTGEKVSYHHKEKNMMFLDHDSLGYGNGITTLADGTVITPKSFSEMVTLRGIIQGEYVVNVHLYSAAKDGLGIKNGNEAKVPVTIKILKINPKVTTVFQKDVVIQKVWEEQTITRFTLGSNGEWLSTDPTPKELKD